MLSTSKEAITGVALEALLPQRRPMLLLDAVLAGDTSFASTRSIVRPEWPLAGETGVDALVLIEIAAQTAGISCSWARLQQKGPDSEQKGWIVAIKRADLHLAELPFGAHIRAEGRNTISYGGFQEVSATLYLQDACIAEVVLQLYQPQEDIHADTKSD
ncbi:MAG: hypothetical protein Q4G66_08535 [bacterium]|nr:hypothetical protein [bacterium]